MTSETISHDSLQDFTDHWDEHLVRYLEPLADTAIVGLSRVGDDDPIARSLKSHFGLNPEQDVFVAGGEFCAAGLSVTPPASALWFIEGIDEADERTPLTKAQALHTLALSLHAADLDPDDLPFE